MVADHRVNKPQAAAGAAPPRTLNVQKFAESRAPELLSLHSLVAARLNNDFRTQRNKRRRTTAHHSKKTSSGKKQKVVNVLGTNHSNVISEKDDDQKNKKKKKKMIPRRIRRRIELKKNPQFGFSASGDGTKRLRTHVWHAKRFTMSKLWGFYLPLSLHGSGKGSRALLKKSNRGVLVHDASYYAAIQLQGPEDLLLSILCKVMVPSPSQNSDQTSQNVLSGVTYARAMLHHVGSVFARAIAPVTYMWQPQNPNFRPRVDKSDTYDKQQSAERYASSRQLWIWIHPAAFREGYDALVSACETMNLNGRSVSCVSLVGELAKLDVIGSKAYQLIQKILHPVTCISTMSWAPQKCSAAINNGRTPQLNSCDLPHEDQISTSGIISLAVNDPRAFMGKGVTVVSEAKSSEVLGAKETEIQWETTLEGIPQWNTDSLASTFLEPEENRQFSEFIDLWDARKVVNPPVEESLICEKRHFQQMKVFNISDENCKSLDASGMGQFSGVCPVMLLKDNSSKDFATRWSIIIPLSWVKAFWITIISNGAQAIGLREKHWITCEAGLPCFPSDFPDTNAYTCFKAREAAIADQKEKLRPPGLRPLRVPNFTPWECLHYGSKERPAGGGEEIFPVSENSGKHCENCDIAAVGGALFNGFVARTSNVLIHYMNLVNDDYFLLFPNLPDGKRCLPKVMKDTELINLQRNGISSQSTFCQNLCLVRVLLHAYKEGVFEEGAVVCAPLATDITMWSTRSEDDGGQLQVPQSLLGSYIVQQPSGRWVLQVPEDPADKKSFRWPIGFVTTGFTRGSKKPTAIALCDAVLLGRLREEQWKTISVHKRRKEIYVLVRNLRSTAYRLALATIVLESQEVDVECM